MSTTIRPLREPDSIFRVLPGTETKLRAQYLRLESTPPSAERHERLLKDIILKSALVLELALAGATVQEILDEMGVTSFQSSGRSAAYFRDRVKQATGLDLSSVYSDAVSGLKVKPTKGNPAGLSMSVVVRVIRSLIEICPIDELETRAGEMEVESTGHRCRVAFDGLKGFVLRNDPRQQAKAAVAGREYQRGSLSIDEVGTLLGLTSGDAAAYLEARGYARPLEAISLPENQRNTQVSSIRTDRLRRSGVLPFDKDAIAREVIASERIENIDARRWVRRTPS